MCKQIVDLEGKIFKMLAMLAGECSNSASLFSTFDNVHPQLKKITERRPTLTVNDVFRFSLNSDNLGWILILQVLQQAKKASEAWSPCVVAMRNKENY